jgi:hypothetical protein
MQFLVEDDLLEIAAFEITAQSCQGHPGTDTTGLCA